MTKAILYKFFQLCITDVQLTSCTTFYGYFNCTEKKFLDVGEIKVSRTPDVFVRLCHSNLSDSHTRFQ